MNNTKTIYEATHFPYLLDGNISIFNSIFKYCISTTMGGAIFVQNSNFQISLYLCAFLLCSSSSYGGGVGIKISKNVLIKSSCFSNCTGSPGCNGYLIWGVANPVLNVEMNLTNENSPSIQAHGSETLSSNNLLFYENNITNSFCSGSFSTFYTGSGYSKEIFNFNQIGKSYAASIIGIYMAISGLQPTFNNFNFFNISLSTGLIEIQNINSNPIFQNSIFYECSKVTILKYLGISNPSSSITFLNCKFSFNYDINLYSSINTNSNYFSIHNLTLIPINLFNTYKCWFDYYNTFNFKISFKFFNLLIILLI